jgi:hypothetical protein
MDELEACELYIHWLYRGPLPVRIDEPGRKGNLEYIQIAQVDILGDRLQDYSFMNTVLNAMLEKPKTRVTDGQTWFPVGPAIRLISENAPGSSKARRLLIDLYIAHAIQLGCEIGRSRTIFQSPF